MRMQQMIFDAMDDEQKQRVMAAQAERDKRTRDSIRGWVVLIATIWIWFWCLANLGLFLGALAALVASSALGWLCIWLWGKEPTPQTTN